MADMRAVTSEALEGVRRMALELRPTMLDDLGLVAALDAYARQFTQRTHIQVELRATGRPDRLPPEVELVVYRVIQEALSNVARHSGGTRAEVSLVAETGRLTVLVADNGHGFDGRAPFAHSEPGHLGLASMRERAELMDGRFEVESSTRGTRVLVLAPLKVAP